MLIFSIFTLVKWVYDKVNVDWLAMYNLYIPSTKVCQLRTHNRSAKFERDPIHLIFDVNVKICFRTFERFFYFRDPISRVEDPITGQRPNTVLGDPIVRVKK